MEPYDNAFWETRSRVTKKKKKNNKDKRKKKVAPTPDTFWKISAGVNWVSEVSSVRRPRSEDHRHEQNFFC